MPPDDRPSLRERVAEAADASRCRLIGAAGTIALDRLLDGTVLGADAHALAGRSVLLATADHAVTAAALLELDGLASRIVLCPADVRPEHVGGLVAATGIEAVVTDRSAEQLPVDPALPALRSHWPPAPKSAPHPPGRRDTEWVILTSGTTGMPKAVLHAFAALTDPVSRASRDPDAVWATFYDIRRYGGLQMYFRGMMGGGSLALSGPGEPIPAFLARLAPLGVTHLAGTPSHWRRALMSPALKALAPRYVRLSGEIADQAVLDALRHAFPKAAVGHAFASTEAGVAFEVDDGLEGFPASYVGRLPSGVEVDIRDGALRIRSSRIARRVLGSNTPIAGPDGFVETGDMMERSGDRFRFAGRQGGVINVGGLKVFPEEVEAVLNRHPGVRMSVVAGRRSPITGAVVSARIVRSEAGAPPNEETLRRDVLAFCRRALPAHKVPALLQVVDAIAVGEAGKIVRTHG